MAWVNMQMMLADAPRYESDGENTEKKKPKEIENESELAEFLGLEL